MEIPQENSAQTRCFSVETVTGSPRAQCVCKGPVKRHAPVPHPDPSLIPHNHGKRLERSGILSLCLPPQSRHTKAELLIQTRGTKPEEPESTLAFVVKHSET